jgi:DNA polymerase
MVPLKSTAQSTASRDARPVPPRFPSLHLEADEWMGPPLSTDARSDVFVALQQQVAGCRNCEELACSRKQTVFGTGCLHPRVVFFGEAPGADEDRKGEPFVGAAGQLLNKIIAASQMKREDVYILNSLKCRPPGNRTPVDIEIENCRPFFEAQLNVLQPEFIVCLGAVSVRAVLRSTESVGQLRGRFHRYRKARVLVTYHPAYLLRNENAKKLVWEDMQLLMGAMGLKLPKG